MPRRRSGEPDHFDKDYGMYESEMRFTSGFGRDPMYNWERDAEEEKQRTRRRTDEEEDAYWTGGTMHRDW